MVDFERGIVRSVTHIVEDGRLLDTHHVYLSLALCYLNFSLFRDYLLHVRYQERILFRNRLPDFALI